MDINSTGDVNLHSVTSETFLSVNFLEELFSPSQCMMFEFSVHGMNIAGDGETATIIDTVPICELINAWQYILPVHIQVSELK